jgi:hypothetical protein
MGRIAPDGARQHDAANAGGETGHTLARAMLESWRLPRS